MVVGYTLQVMVVVVLLLLLVPSTGTAQTHEIGDDSLIAYKLATKEAISYEEEEDTMLPLVSIIRDAVVRRMARTSEIGVVRGAGITASSNFDPLRGLVTVATKTISSSWWFRS